jgi:hypothetical protein
MGSTRTSGNLPSVPGAAPARIIKPGPETLSDDAVIRNIPLNYHPKSKPEMARMIMVVSKKDDRRSEWAVIAIVCPRFSPEEA